MTTLRSALVLSLMALVSLAACRRQASPAPSRLELCKGFQTQISDEPPDHDPAPVPPPGLFEKVTYPAPLGANVAYVTPVREGAKRPAVLWIQGGFDWTIGESAWEEAPRENDQSARAFREAGLVLMFPALRGSNENPGSREYFLGEVDDVLAALEFLARRPDVDPERVFLGGHSTGATMALLAAASGARVRGVFAFGPIDDVSRYGETGTALDRATGKELWLRNPLSFMGAIRAPTLVIEGSENGNTSSFETLSRAASGAPVRFVEVPGGSHFDILAPVTELLAGRIAQGDPAAVPTELTQGEALAAMQAEAAAR